MRLPRGILPVGDLFVTTQALQEPEPNSGEGGARARRFLHPSPGPAILAV